VHNNRRTGVFVQDGGAPTLLENDIFRNTVGVEAVDDAAPVVRGNWLHRHKLGGVWVHKGGGGTYEGNEMRENGKAAVRVWDNGNPVLKGNSIWGGRTVGLLVYEFGKGHYVDNEIHSHRSWNIEVKRNAFPLIERNKIHSSKYGGVYCHGGGGTHLESEEVRFTLKDNEIYANTGIGVSIGDDGSPLVEGNHIHSGHTAAVYVAGASARGVVTNNLLEGNKDGVVIREGGAPRVEGNTIRGQSRRGVFVTARGQGAVLRNAISDSGLCNVEVRGEERRAAEPEAEASELNKKKAAYASLGMLVPLSTDGVVIAGALTDESGATTVTLRLNAISGGGGPCSVLLTDHAKGFVKENSIRGAAGDGLVIAHGADPDVVGNTVADCGGSGVRVRAGGKGRLQNNVVSGHGGAGVAVGAASEPDLRGNRLKASRHGLLVEEGGGGHFSANTIEANGCGVRMLAGATAQLRANHIAGNAGAGVEVSGAGGPCLLVENEIHANGGAGVAVGDGAHPLLEKNGIRDNRSGGVHVAAGARGKLLRNVIERNAGRGLRVEAGAAPVLGENFVQSNEEDGDETAAAGAAVPRAEEGDDVIGEES